MERGGGIEKRVGVDDFFLGAFLGGDEEVGGDVEGEGVESLVVLFRCVNLRGSPSAHSSPSLTH